MRSAPTIHTIFINRKYDIDTQQIPPVNLNKTSSKNNRYQAQQTKYARKERCSGKEKLRSGFLTPNIARNYRAIITRNHTPIFSYRGGAEKRHRVEKSGSRFVTEPRGNSTLMSRFYRGAARN
ncbi:hypothetical protein L484_004485 [Morus notabilis]|uniref:Uncharacterized protein n=1 Tax=Morus notabilis TaxID=981085 RepID=W9QXR0_9ROSA|nr:hypothetical protein L484_004485 [Morus notabilis]